MRLQGLFAQRQVFAAAVLLGVLLSLPTLGGGLVLDDYQQRIALLGGGHGNAFEFFHRGTPAGEAQMQSGVLAWWTHPDTKVVFFRPAAQWLLQLDYRLWPDSLLLMHLHSVLWYALTVFIAGLCYRQFMPTRWAAGFAAVLFAVDAAHGPAVSWLANRNAFVGLSIALLVLLCYRQRSFLWQLAGWALFACSMACSEGALAITGYFFAFELCLSDQPWHRRILRLLPHGFIAMAWLMFWKHGGYGTAGPGWYIDPAGEPALFLHEMLFRLPVYLVGQFFLPPAELLAVTEDSAAMPYAWLYAIGAVALLGWLLMPLLRSSRLARFYAVGLLIAAIPICGSIPVGRSLWFLGFGATGLLALFVEQFRGLSLTPLRLRLSAAFAATMVGLHLWLSPVLFVLYGMVNHVMDNNMDSRRVQLPDEGAPGKKILALDAASYIGNITFPLLKDQALSLGAAPTRPAPSIAHIRALAEGTGEFELSRKDADTLVLNSAKGLDSLRPSRYGFAAGDRVVLDDVEILVRAVSPARAPTVIEYRFHPGVLESYEIITWQGNHFVPAALPAPGASLEVKTEGS